MLTEGSAGDTQQGRLHASNEAQRLQPRRLLLSHLLGWEELQNVDPKRAIYRKTGAVDYASVHM
jgi:hypothetical protein